MEKLDRLGWAAGFAFRAYGLRIGVRVNTVDLEEAVCRHFPAGVSPLASSVVERLYSLVASEPSRLRSIRRFNFLYRDSHQIARTTRVEDLFQIMESDMDSFIAQRARGSIFVHAGVVRFWNRVVVIPGRSQSGKTTLVRALLELGATYYSDEYAVFDRSGHIRPFPRAMFIRGNEEHSVTRMPVEDRGSQKGNDGLPVGLILLTRYQAGAHWKPRMLSPGRGVLGLLANTATARKQPKVAMEVLGRTVGNVPVLAGTRGEATETAVAIRQWLQTSESSSVDVTKVS